MTIGAVSNAKFEAAPFATLKGLVKCDSPSLYYTISKLFLYCCGDSPMSMRNRLLK